MLIPYEQADTTEYHCTECDDSFYVDTYELFSNTGRKPYVCPFCGSVSQEDCLTLTDEQLEN